MFYTVFKRWNAYENGGKVTNGQIETTLFCQLEKAVVEKQMGEYKPDIK